LRKKKKNLKSLYRYAHQFYREKPIHKSIPLDTAVHVLGTLLPVSCLLLNPFREFLLKQTEYKVINLDQWMNIYEFLFTVSQNEINDYSEISSWPYIIDLFVEWRKEAKNGQTEENEKKVGEEGEDILMTGKLEKM